MQSLATKIGLIFLLLISLTSCSAIEGVFNAGMGVGVFLVIIVIVIIVFIIAKMGGKK